MTDCTWLAMLSRSIILHRLLTCLTNASISLVASATDNGSLARKAVVGLDGHLVASTAPRGNVFEHFSVGACVTR